MSVCTAYINHLTGPARGTGCCDPTKGKHCSTGVRLSAAYRVALTGLPNNE